MDPLKAHLTTYATHELEDARARIGRELSRRRAAQVADAAEDFPKPQTAHQRAKRDLFRALYDGPPAILHRLQLERVNGQVARRSCLCGGWEWLGDAGPAAGDSFNRHLEEDRERRQHAARLVHVTVPQDGRPALATWDKLQAALKDAGVTVTQGSWRPTGTGDTHVSGPDLDVPDTPEGRKLWQAHQDQFQAEEAEEAALGVDEDTDPHHAAQKLAELREAATGWPVLAALVAERDRLAAAIERIEHDARCPHPKCPGHGMCCCPEAKP